MDSNGPKWTKMDNSHPLSPYRPLLSIQVHSCPFSFASSRLCAFALKKNRARAGARARNYCHVTYLFDTCGKIQVGGIWKMVVGSVNV